MKNSIDPIKCPYCNKDALLVGGKDVYPYRKDLYDNKFWLCKSCDAYVGTHSNSKSHKPFGTMANSELRLARRHLHDIFDPMWKPDWVGMNRNDAYRWLAKELKIDQSKCHIGMFDLSRCRKAIQIVESYMSRKLK